MKKQKHTTNPTKIIEIPKSSVSARIDRNKRGEIEKLSIESIDLAGADLSADSRILIIAKARNTEMVFDGGTVSSRRPIIDEPLSEIDKSSPFHLRVIVFDDSTKIILGSCERLAIHDDEEGGVQSLLPVEPTDLGEQVWRLKTIDGERPILLVSDDPEFGMLDRVKSDPFVQALILPEAIRGVLEHLLLNPSEGDEITCWQEAWARYLVGLGIELYALDEDEGINEAAREWIDDTAYAIARQLKLKTKALLSFGSAENG